MKCHLGSEQKSHFSMGTNRINISHQMSLRSVGITTVTILISLFAEQNEIPFFHQILSFRAKTRRTSPLSTISEMSDLNSTIFGIL